jgi:hypothetical protein
MFAQAYMGRKRCFQMLSLYWRRILALGRSLLAYVTEALEGAAPIFSAHVSGFPARGATNIRVCGFH